MQYKITITLQDDKSFGNLIYTNTLLSKLFLHCQITGECMLTYDDCNYYIKRTKNGYSINGYCKKEGENEMA